VIPILAYAIWKYTNSILQRVKQYDPLYDGLMSAISDYQQLQENLMAFSQILRAAGVQMFEVTGLQWGNRSPLVVIACDQPVPLGSKLAVISVDTLNALGRFEVIQSTFGGYLAQEDLILDPVWWGYLHQKLDISPHPRFDDSAVAILLDCSRALAPSSTTASPAMARFT
jgi:hypothetical protein